MVVKDKTGRTRYVSFRVEGGPVARPALGAKLPESARLTRFDGVHGIVRTTHLRRDEVLTALAGITAVSGRTVNLETISTSGTIRGAAASLPPDAGAARANRAEWRRRKAATAARKPEARGG